MTNDNETERARSALQSIPPDLPHDQWVRVGMAAHAGGLSFDEWDGWSQQGGNYNPATARDAWRSFSDKPGGVTVATLFQIARGSGWVDRSSSGANQRQAPAVGFAGLIDKPTAPAPEKKFKRGMSPDEVWGRCEPVPPDHPYIIKKGLQNAPLSSLRMLPAGDWLHITGKRMGGALVVPGYNFDGELCSLQFVPEEGKKLNLPGASISGLMHPLGEIVPGAKIQIVEGIGTAWTVWAAGDGLPVVAFGWGNVARVATEWRQRDSAAQIGILPDVGKEENAAKIAATVGASVACMPAGWPNNADLNDLAQREGMDAVRAVLASAAQPAQPPAPEPPPPMLRAVSIADLFTHPSPDIAHVWGQLVPRGVVTMWGAHGGTGKSMMALMLCVAVAVGRDLFGQSTDRSPVLFVSLEDAAHVVRGRLSKICKAWQVNPVDLAGQLHIVDGTQNPELYEAEHRNGGQTTPTYSELAQLAQQVGAGLIVIDNASDAYGGDEINRRQVRAFIRTLAKIASDGMRGIVLLSHVDKGTSRNGAAQNGEGYSGSTAWNNSVRSRLFMARQSNGSILIEHQKSNLGPMQAPLTLVWPADGLPELANNSPDYSGLNDRAQGRADDTAAAGLLSLIAEFEGRGQYCSPAITSKNTPFSMLASEPAFKRMGLSKDDVRRIVNQCQRAGWLAPLDYRTPNRKDSQRWTLTDKGREFAGLIPQSAPTAPSCANYEDGASWSMEQSGTEDGAPTAPSCAGVIGVRERTEMAQQDGAQTASFSGADEGEI